MNLKTNLLQVSLENFFTHIDLINQRNHLREKKGKDNAADE